MSELSKDEGFDSIIEPKKGWIPVNFSELWQYRELAYILAWRDVKIRYKQTVLGAAWALFQPFISMIVFTIFFGNLVKVPSDGFPYPIFVFAGLLPWTFFANSMSAASNSLIGQSNLISKVYFPRLLIPFSTFGAFILDFAISFLIMLGMMIYYGVHPNISILMFPVLLIATMATALGVGTLLSALCVAYRDVKYIVPFLVQLWMYATPVIYPVSIVPARWRWLLSLNPMSGLVDGFRSAFLGKPFDWQNISISLVSAVVFMCLGLAYFRKVERRFADIV
jgi:lipopolysaccharide transport system permease protein